MADQGGAHHGIDYIEFAAPDLDAVKQFYTSAFGWAFRDYGPDYCGFVDGARGEREAGGIRRGEAVAGGPLVVLFSRDLEASLAAVKAAGGRIEKEITSFPGGRRFELSDPGGNRLAVWTQA